MPVTRLIIDRVHSQLYVRGRKDVRDDVARLVSCDGVKTAVSDRMLTVFFIKTAAELLQSGSRSSDVVLASKHAIHNTMNAKGAVTNGRTASDD